MESLVKIHEGYEKLLATLMFLVKLCGLTDTQMDMHAETVHYFCSPIVFQGGREQLILNLL